MRPTPWPAMNADPEFGIVLMSSLQLSEIQQSSITVAPAQ
jgi:hypothetical protein